MKGATVIVNEKETDYINNHDQHDAALHAVLSDMMDDGAISSDGEGNYQVPSDNFVEDVVGVCVFWYLKGYDAFTDNAMKHDETCKCVRCVFEACVVMEHKGEMERVADGNWRLTEKGRASRDSHN